MPGHTSDESSNKENQIRKHSYMLWKALDEREINKIKELLNSLEIDPNQVRDRSTPLIFAIRTNQNEATMELLKNDKIDINKAMYNGVTPLFMAAQQGNLEAVKILLSRGTNLNQARDDGWSPLMIAAENGYLDVVNELLKHGAELNVENKYNETPLSLAKDGGHHDIAQTLLSHGADPNFGKIIPHRFFIQYMIDLGYKANRDGICFGYANMGMQAMLSKDMKTFDDRLHKIEKDADADEQDKLSTFQRGKEGITPFLDGVELYFQAANYPQLFEQDKRPTSQDTLLTSPLVMSKTIREQGGLVKNANFSGVYDIKELTEYFKSLKESIRNTDPPYTKPVPLVLTSAGHAITVGYDPTRLDPTTNKGNPWVFIDANKIPTRYLKNEEDIAKAVMKGFLPSLQGKVVFNTQIFATQSNKERLHRVISNWQAKDGSWDNLHRVSDEKARYISESSGSWLFSAARNGQINIIKELLEHGADPNELSYLGTTPLYIAAQTGQLEIVKFLLSCGANPNQARDNGFTPLIVAAENGHVEVVKELSLKVDPSQANAQGVTPLIMAAQNGHLEVVEELLKNPKIDPNAAMSNGLTPLYVAAQNGHLGVVEELLKNPKIDPNKADAQGVTPLYVAAQNGHFGVVEELLKNPKIDPNAAMNNGFTPLLIAAQNGHLGVVEELLKNPKIDPNKADAQGVTPLCIAAHNGHPGVVEELLKNPKIDPNAAMNNGLTPLYIAAEKGDLEVVKALLKKQNIALYKTFSGKTLLEIAGQNKHSDVVQELKQAMQSRLEEDIRSAANIEELIAIVSVNEELGDNVSVDACINVPKCFDKLIEEKEKFFDGDFAYNDGIVVYNKYGIREKLLSLAQAKYHKILEEKQLSADIPEAIKSATSVQDLLDVMLEYKEKGVIFDPDYLIALEILLENPKRFQELVDKKEQFFSLDNLSEIGIDILEKPDQFGLREKLLSLAIAKDQENLAALEEEKKPPNTTPTTRAEPIARHYQLTTEQKKKQEDKEQPQPHQEKSYKP